MEVEYPGPFQNGQWESIEPDVFLLDGAGVIQFGQEFTVQAVGIPGGYTTGRLAHALAKGIVGMACDRFTANRA